MSVRFKDVKEVFPIFKAYIDKHGSEWGGLHVILSDRNISDRHVKACLKEAVDREDKETAELAEILLSLSKTQRGRIAKEVKSG